MSLSSYDGARLERRKRTQAPKPLAEGLAWFSIGLGIAELAAPRAMARLIGVTDDPANEAVLRTAGLREVASGLGILATPESRAPLWGRFAGDVMDLLLLAGASTQPRSDRTRLSLATAAVLGVTTLDLLGALPAERGHSVQGLAKRALPERITQGVRVKTAVTVNRPRAEVYAFWRKLENLPRFMSHLESVTAIDGTRSKWKAKAPLGASVAWEADIVRDVTDAEIAWSSAEHADIRNEGSVRFRDADGRRATEVLVELVYHPPGGAVGAAFAKLFGEEPSEQVKGDLRRFKQVMEVGEVVHSDASIHRGMHPGRPTLSKEVHS